MPAKKLSTVDALKRGMGTSPAAEAKPLVGGRQSATAPQLPPRPEKPVRFTLDLDRDRHRFLKDYAVQTETDASVVLRALIDQLRDDPDLAARVQARVWQARQRS